MFSRVKLGNTNFNGKVRQKKLYYKISYVMHHWETWHLS